MKLRILFGLSLAVPMLAVRPMAPVDEFGFLPKEGLVVTKSFSMTSETEQTTYSERGDTTNSSTAEYTLVVTDTIAAAEDGRVTKLERVFDEVDAANESTLDFVGESREFSMSGSSELEDGTVTFVWDEDEEEYEISSDDIDDDLLEDLRYDYDFTALLPDEEVDEDDEWEIDLDAFHDLMNFQGGIPMDWERSDGEVTSERSDADDQEEPDIEESHEGEITAKYAGTREEEGVTVAVIEIEGEYDTERSVEQSRDLERGSSSFHQETTETRSLIGEVLWNVEGGHLHSLEIEVELSGSGTMKSSFRMGDREFNNDSESEQSGTVTLTVSFEADQCWSWGVRGTGRSG